MPRLTVGLDIGTSGVRAAEIDVSKSTPTLLTYGQVGLPPGSLVDGEIRDSTAVTEAIQKLWKNGQFSGTSVIVGIAGLRAITREIDLPYVPDDEIDSAVRFQSEEVIPFPPEQTLLSSQVLADYTNDESARMRRVLVAAAHVDLVNGVIDVVEAAGLTVEGVDLISSALVRALGGPAEEDASGVTEQPEAVVSIGAGLTVVVVHQGGRPQFVRTIGSGGNATTAAISAALDIPIVDAETLKYRFGEDNAQIQAAERVAQPSMLELTEEIRNSIQYFASLPDRLPVSRVVLTGGGSGLKGLSVMLQNKVRIPVAFGSPFDRLDTSKLDLDPDQAAMVIPVLASPIGLALPEPDSAVKKFNLLPPEVAHKARMRRIQQRTLVGSVAVLALLVLFGGWKFLQVHNAENSVSGLQSNIASLNAQVPKYSLVVAANDAYTQGLARRESVLNSAVDWPLALNSLIAITPPKASVLTFAGSQLSAIGDTTTGPKPGVATGTQSAAIGTVDLDVNGPGPSLSISEAWIDAISTSQLFANPLQGATTVESNSSISFPFTISVTPAASLSKNASLK
jgi:type IV pilus assembly protein PilM